MAAATRKAIKREAMVNAIITGAPAIEHAVVVWWLRNRAGLCPQSPFNRLAHLQRP